jgi:hypothetical protein
MSIAIVLHGEGPIILRLHGLALHTSKVYVSIQSGAITRVMTAVCDGQLVSLSKHREHNNVQTSGLSKAHWSQEESSAGILRPTKEVEERGRVSAASEIILRFLKISSQLTQQFDSTPEFGNPAQHDHRSSGEPSFAAQDRPAPREKCRPTCCTSPGKLAHSHTLALTSINLLIARCCRRSKFG